MYTKVQNVQTCQTHKKGAWCDFDDIKVDEKICENFLQNNDSYNFFCTHLPENLIQTGLTFTNVMDVHLIFIK